MIQIQDQKRPPFVEQALFCASQIRKIEQQAAQSGGYALYQLMESAGLEAWNWIQRYWPESQTITVVCGKGNNAGDGFVLATIAAKQGKTVQVLLVEADVKFKGDAQTAFQAMQQQGIRPQPFEISLLKDQQLIVDAILGTGFQGPLRKNFQQIIEAINSFSHSSPRALEGTPIFSIDIPSGLESDTGFANPVAIQADRTLTFIALKSGMVTGHARACCGVIELSMLGTDTRLQEQFTAHAWIDDADQLIENLPERSKISHKGEHGHLLLIGGDYGFGGAILMSAMAAARCGAGMLTILTRDAHVAPILTQCPEAMIRSIDGAEDSALNEILAKVDAVVIGPGLGQGEWGRGILEMICTTELPLLIDADALNILAGQTEGKEQWVMTPHPGEAGNLLDMTSQQIQQDRYSAVGRLQDKYLGAIVLKGAGTLISSNNKLVTVCNEGNPGMASAGMGDILSGIIGSLLAQGLETNLAARTGVALHARAGDLAAMKGLKGLMATDLIDPLRLLVNP